jgi:multidrug efflux pump
MSVDSNKPAFTDLFIKSPVIALVVNLIILVVGWRCVSSLAVRQYPRIESGSVIIRTMYIGASAETIRGFVTTPIERAVSAIDGIDYIESNSVSGLSTITVRLKLNYDTTDALANIGARLDQVRSELPQEAESPVIEVQRADRSYATFYLGFTSDSMDLTQLTDYLAREVQPELGILPGVQRVGIEGGRFLAMRIWLDPDRMNALSIASQDVVASLRRNNFLATVGQSKSDSIQVDLMTDTDLRSVSEFEDLIVRSADGTLVRLRDIAKVELGYEEPMAQTGIDGKPGIYLSVWPLPSSNELDVGAALKSAMQRIGPTLPSSIKMSLAYDGTYYMENALKEITKTLIETVAVVGLIVFIFMGSIRTVLVPLIAMPISLVGACIAMVLLGFSLNLLTILAIVLSVGLVVDDAIVIVENVERHIRSGMTKTAAAIRGARELVTPIISMTITLAAVYAPIGFQTGLTGVLFKEFAFTLAAAVIFSGIVAVTLSPVMSAIMVPSSGKESRFSRFVNARFDALRRAYERVLMRFLEIRMTIALIAILIAAGAWPLYATSKKELAPTEDEGFIFVFFQSAPDATLKYTLGGVVQAADNMRKFDESESFFNVTFPTGGFGGMKAIDWSSRERTTAEMIPQAMGALGSIREVSAFPSLPPPLPNAGQFAVELMVTSSEEAERMAVHAGDLIGAAMGSGLFLYADSDLKLDLPQTKLVIDKKRVADLGLDLAAVGQDLGIMLSGAYVNRFNLDGRSYKVIPQIRSEGRVSPDQLLQLKVRTGDGGLASVSSFVKLETRAAPRSLNRFQQRNSFKIYGMTAPGVTKEEGLRMLEDASRATLPAGYSIDYAGESRQIRAEGNTLAGTLGFALLIIYLVLAAQFGSFRDPLIVLLGSVPLAITGALIFTYLGYTTVNIYSQVGLITLVGLVAKNGILIVEFANSLREQGIDKIEAAKQSAATRLRPILMTSAATVFGHFPLVLVTGAGAEARNSIGIVLVTGMTISTLFTLFVVPALYVMLSGEKRRADESMAS